MTLPRNDRGSVLIVASLFTFLTLLAAFTLFKVLPVEYNAAMGSRLDMSAHYVVDAGVKDAFAWIESQPQRRILSNDVLDEFNNEFGQRAEFSPDWEKQVTIERIESNHFGITSQAFFRGKKAREVKAQVAKKSFAGYALFIDHWPFDGPGETPLVYTLGEELLTGPFHTNDFFILAHQTDEGFLSEGRPFVSGPYAVMTHSRSTSVLQGPVTDFPGDGNAYVSGFQGSTPILNNSVNHVPFDAEGVLEDRYDRIVDGGRGSLDRVRTIDFPEVAVDADGTPLREKARGIGNPEFQNSGRLELGVHVPSNEQGDVLGGIYIVGDSEITLGVDENGNHLQNISQTHLAEAYFQSETQEVTSPRYVPRETDTPPEFIDEVQQVEGFRRVILRYESNTVTTSDGLTQPVETPVYGQEPITTQQVVSVPYDPAVHGEGPWTVYEEDLDNPYRYETIVLTPISEEEYDENNPAHSLQFQEAGERAYQVIEVTSEAGYQLPAGGQIEGVITTGTVPKDHTVFVDHQENRTVVSRGNLNGVTFAEGHIEALSGVNKGAIVDGPQGHAFSGRTLVAAPEFGKHIQITNHLRQFSADHPGGVLPQDELPSNAHHALGLMAHDVEMAPDFQTSKASPLTIYAVILAGSGRYNPDGTPRLGPDEHQVTTGGFGTHPDLLDPSSRFRVGAFKVVGGVIEGNARPWFEAPGGTLKGLEATLVYDPAAAAAMQNFPTTQALRTIRYSEYVSFD